MKKWQSKLSKRWNKKNFLTIEARRSMKTIQKQFLLVSVFVMIMSSSASSQISPDIRLNQIGFYPSMKKIAIVRSVGSSQFFVLCGTDTVYSGTLSSLRHWSYSNEDVSVADFSSLKIPGSYALFVPGVGYSYPFKINERVNLELAKGALKGYYFQRASLPLDASFAGKWARPAGHPDTAVLIHSSAATPGRPVNSKMSSPRGWYDAGDYNKYIVNSGITTYSLLAAYEHFPKYCSELVLSIPESNNKLPDILDEALWNVRWMLTMQDPADGGVYHKLTNTNFDGMIMPHQATTPRYVVMKSTAASLDFAAVMAQMSRIARNFPAELPGLADSCLHAAVRAWNWARLHPKVYYNQTQVNAKYDPDIHTGEYGDSNVSDEFAWAAAELFVTTKCDSFLTIANPLSGGSALIPSWSNVRTLGLYTFAHYRNDIAGKIDTNKLRSRLLSLAASLSSTQSSSAYQVVIGSSAKDFGWGSNAIAANQAMALLVAYQLTSEPVYLNAALSNLDYLLGRNALGYCFVTGFGSRSPMFIHHRISAADGVTEPVPGLLVGGPNPKCEDRLQYHSTLPALAYLDTVASYASNEICINWNAPLVYVTIALEALLSPNGLPVETLRNSINEVIPSQDEPFLKQHRQTQ